MDAKQTIRERMLRRRAERPVDPTRAGEAVSRHLRTLPELQAARTVAAYCAVAGEVDISPYIRYALTRKISVLLPRFNPQSRSYELAGIADFASDVESGKFGIPEPAPRQPASRPELWRAPGTAWLIPGVAFDRFGNRIGHGRGHYDALLQGARGVRIGVAFDWQILDELPREAHDAPMHIIVSERHMIRCRRPAGRSAAPKTIRER